MLLSDLTSYVRSSERAILPNGGETGLWGDYCTRMQQVTGVLPYADGDADVPANEAEWWMEVYAAFEADPNTDLELLKASIIVL